MAAAEAENNIGLPTKKGGCVGHGPLDHFCTRGQDLALANGNRLFVQFNAIKFDGRIKVGDLPKIATQRST